MQLAEARRILENASNHSKMLVERAKEVIDKSVRKGDKPMKMQRGGKVEMAYGGTVMGKRHMYVAGGSVKMNPGLIALKKANVGTTN